jgi:hypothetical protein
MKQKKKSKHVKVTKRLTKAGNLVSVVEDEATPKLKKKSKRQLKERNSPVEAEIPLESNDADTLRLKKKNKKVKEGKSSVEPSDADDILHDENPDEESLRGKICFRVNTLTDELCLNHDV